MADIAPPPPGVVVTIDSPGFTLRLLRRIAPLGIPRVHYVAPQVWAWRERRVRHYPGLWDTLLCLLPFEPEFFARHGLAGDLRRPSRCWKAAPTGRRRPVPRRARPRAGGARADADAGQPPHRGRAGCCRCSARRCALLAPRVPGLRAGACRSPPLVAAAVRARPPRWPVRPIIVTELADKHDAFAASRGRAHQIGHLDPGAGAGWRADGGRLPRQPAHRRDRAAAGQGALCLAGQPAGRARRWCPNCCSRTARPERAGRPCCAAARRPRRAPRRSARRFRAGARRAPPAGGHAVRGRRRAPCSRLLDQA